MKRILAIGLALTFLSVAAGADDFITDYEASRHLETPRYAETIGYAKRLAGASRWLTYTSFGTSPQGRELPLLIADKDGRFDPDRVDRRRKAVVMIQACIHAGESDGKDAGLMLLRDIAVGRELSALLDNVTILFIPIFNVDGHENFGPYNRINQNGPEEMGYRVNAQRLNLNRDYVKLDTEELRAWIRLFNAWDPDFFVDCHTTDGADYQYPLTYLLERRVTVFAGLRDWLNEGYLPTMERRMAASGFPIFHYVWPIEWPDVRGGLRDDSSPPRFSTVYTATRNRPGLLIETHMLKDYRTRVSATYEMLEHTLEYVNVHRDELRELVAEADRWTASREFRKVPYALRYELDKEPRHIEFAGFDYTSVKSDLTGGKWIQFSDRPDTMQVPFYGVHPTVFANLPEAYIIPPQWTDVIARLEMHGLPVKRLTEEATLTVDSYRFENVTWEPTPFEGRHPAKFDTQDIKESRTYPAGSVVLPMDHALAGIVAHIMEPQGPDSYVTWGFFNTIFEQKESAASYVMEELAREMLADDPELLSRYERLKVESPDFAGDPKAQLNWFYQHTPYWDDRINVYPVGKIFDADVVESLTLD